MKNFLVSLLLCAIVIFLLTNNQTSANAKGFGASSFMLDNSMQVIVIPNTKVPAVSHMVWYKIGAQDEPAGKSGIAHFLEHLMFKGTTRYSEFSKTIAKAGGNDNAFTGADYTAYFQNISRDKLELVMDMEADRMENINFTEDDVKRERDVILEERSSRVDNKPGSLLREQMKAALYLNHPYQRPLIGWRHEMEQLNLNDASTWHENYYAPNNAVLIVSGDITAKELKPLAEKYYGKIKAREVPQRHNLQEPKSLAPTNISLSDEKVKKPEWARYYIAPSKNTDLSEHCEPLTLLSYILGGSNTSRLYQSMVVEKQSAVSIGSYYDDLKLGNSVFSISGTPTDSSNLDIIQDEVEQEIANIKTNGVTIEELDRAKKAIIAQTIYAREDLKTLAYFYGQIVATNVDIAYADKWEEKINAVTLEQVKSAANAVLQINNSVTGRLLVGQ